MTEQTVIDLGLKAIWISTLISAPALISILVTGLIVSVLQAATQVNEQTLSFIPKMIVMTIALAICGPWILETFIHFTIGIFNTIPTVTRG
jgi:flagellar biosynthetic protein FliQ